MALQILDHKEEGYQRKVDFESWTVALMNHTARTTKEGLTYIERHMETDEVFVLLNGSATLLIGLEMEEVPMETNRIYNVEKATWHGILITEGSQVLIVENSNTTRANSEYHDL